MKYQNKKRGMFLFVMSMVSLLFIANEPRKARKLLSKRSGIVGVPREVVYDKQNIATMVSEMPVKEQKEFKKTMNTIEGFSDEAIQEYMQDLKEKNYGFQSKEDAALGETLSQEYVLLFALHLLCEQRSDMLLSDLEGGNPGLIFNNKEAIESHKEAVKENFTLFTNAVKKQSKKSYKNATVAFSQLKKILCSINPEALKSNKIEKKKTLRQILSFFKKEKFDATTFLLQYVFGKNFSEMLNLFRLKEKMQDEEIIMTIYRGLVDIIVVNDQLKIDPFRAFFEDKVLLQKKIEKVSMKKVFGKEISEKDRIILCTLRANDNLFYFYEKLLSIGSINFKKIPDNYQSVSNWKKYGKKGVIALTALAATYALIKVAQKEGFMFSDFLGKAGEKVKKGYRYAKEKVGKVKNWVKGKLSPAKESENTGPLLERYVDRDDTMIHEEPAPVMAKKPSSVMSEREGFSEVDAQRKPTFTPDYFYDNEGQW